MDTLLDDAITKARTLPREMQDEMARIMMTYAGSDWPPLQLTAEEEADLAEADAEVLRGEFATDEEVSAVFAKYAM